MNDKSLYNKRLFKLYGIPFLIGIGLFIICFLSVLIFDMTPSTQEPLGVILGILIAVLNFAPIVLFAFGYNQINVDEIGVVLEFGKPLFQVSTGLIFTPFPFKLHKETKLVIEEQYPEDEKAENGNVSKIYVTHGTSQSTSNDALDNRITTSISIVCRYRIVDLKIFLASIGNKEQLRKQIRDIVVTTTQIECSKETVGKNYSRLTEINSKLKTAVETLTSNWGIQIITVLLQNIDLGGAINEALYNVPISIINKEVNKNNAQKIYYEGLAEADVYKALQYAKAEGYKKIAEELNIPEAKVLYQIDAITNVFQKGNNDFIFSGGEQGELFKMIATIFKMGKSV